jgi:uncharacterized protein HemX
MSPADPIAALQAIPAELRDTREVMKNLHTEVQQSRRKTTWLVRACIVIAAVALGAVGWTAYQQTILDDKSAAIARLANQNAALTRQNAARQAADARHAHDLCVKLNRTRAEILTVWVRVLSGRPDGAMLLHTVKEAEPLGKCPEASPAGR